MKVFLRRSMAWVWLGLGSVSTLTGQSLAPTDPAATFLHAENPTQRERARRILIGRRRAALPTLDVALTSPDPRLRETATYTLGGLEGDDVSERLIHLLDDSDDGVRIAAMRLLGARGLGRIPDGLTDAAESELWSLRRAAALALARCDDDQTIPLLSSLAADPDLDVREAAFSSLFASTVPRADEVLAAQYEPQDDERRRQILERLAHPTLAPVIALLEREFRNSANPRLSMQAGASLATLIDDALPDPTLLAGATPRIDRDAQNRLFNLDTSTRIVAASISSDPFVAIPATFILARCRPQSLDAIYQALRAAHDADSEALARLLVALQGAGARSRLLAIASNQIDATPAGVTGAVAALRLFRTPKTTEDLAWIYSTELPRPTREELCAAFEDLPQSLGARSGLLSVLGDSDSNLRLRAFRVLLRYGASTRDEIDWLLQRVIAEKTPYVRSRMARLVASSAEGEGASQFVERWTRRLIAEPEHRDDVIAALENLRDPILRAKTGGLVIDSYPGPFDAEILRLLTRLKSPRTDAFVAEHLRQALSRGDAELATRLLIALQHGGGERSLEAARLALANDASEVRDRALRTLLRRGDPAGFDALRATFAELDVDERPEVLALLSHGDSEAVAELLTDLLDSENDPLIAAALVERCGELKLPVAERLLPYADPGRGDFVRIHAAEALAAIGGDEARARLSLLFEEAISAAPLGEWNSDQRLFLESVSRAAARLGDDELSQPLASILFSRASRLEAHQYDTDAAFAFEQTILDALLDLAKNAPHGVNVIAALEQELDRQAESGNLYLFPKALFSRFAKALEAKGVSDLPEFRPLYSELLRLAIDLPPTADRRELTSATALAKIATDEGDFLAASHYLAHAATLVDYYGVDGARFLRESLGAPNPVLGSDPRRRLRADIEISQARSLINRDSVGAIAAYHRAAKAAPHDAWLHLTIAGELGSAGISHEETLTFAYRALTLGATDGEIVIRVARIAAGAGDSATFEKARATFSELRDAGLIADQSIHRIALAESLVRLGRLDEAKRELLTAIEMTPSVRPWILDDPALHALIEANQDSSDPSEGD